MHSAASDSLNRVALFTLLAVFLPIVAHITLHVLVVTFLVLLSPFSCPFCRCHSAYRGTLLFSGTLPTVGSLTIRGLISCCGSIRVYRALVGYVSLRQFVVFI